MIKKETGVVMRGVAIAAIMLHNWLHMFRFSTENEFEYSMSRSIYLWQHLDIHHIIHSMGEVVSFIGWIGVFVFVFLSGYGLEKKYGNRDVKAGEFLFRQWKKLISLMIVGVVFFALWCWNTRSWAFLMTLTMTANIIGTRFMQIGVYWYFGLAFQLYILWLIVRRLQVKWLVVVGVALLALKASFAYTPWEMKLNHNIVGWGFMLIAGMITARKKPSFEVKRWVVWVLATVGVVAIVACNFMLFTWVIVLPFLSVMTIWAMASLMMRYDYLKRIGLWLGQLSPFLFACHPIVREILLDPACDILIWPLRSLIFIASAIILSMVYQWGYGKMKRNKG